MLVRLAVAYHKPKSLTWHPPITAPSPCSALLHHTLQGRQKVAVMLVVPGEHTLLTHTHQLLAEQRVGEGGEIEERGNPAGGPWCLAAARVECQGRHAALRALGLGA